VPTPAEPPPPARERAAGRGLPLLKRLRHRLEWGGVALLAFLIPLLPRRAVLALADALGILWFALDRRSRDVALENLRLALGETLSPAELRRVARRSFRNSARTSVDLFWATRLTPHNYRDYVEMVGWEDPLRAYRERRPTLYYTLHWGNFEWLSLAVGFFGVNGPIVGQDFKNPLLGPLYNARRAHAGHRIIPREGAIRRLLREMRSGGHAAVLVDLTLRPEMPSVVIRSFGRLTCVTQIHALLHRRTGAALVPVECLPLPRGRYRVIAHPPIDAPPDLAEHDLVQRCWDLFESRIRARPDLWLWAYKHWRYLPSNPDTTYPSYANPSRAFQERLAAQRSPEQPAAPRGRIPGKPAP
jgi:lauroyl/myristoyl acyltransferase